LTVITRDPPEDDHSLVRRADDGDGASTLAADTVRPPKRALHRDKLFLEPGELPWLPVSEPAFLLWVLAALVLVWVGIAVALRVS
jgi:hypothetical protein